MSLDSPSPSNGAEERIDRIRRGRQRPMDPALPSPKYKNGRSRVTNHRDLLPGWDGRSAGGRRYRDLVCQIAVDQGGLDRCSEARIQLVRRFAASCVMAEEMESRLVNGEKISIVEHALLCSTLVRIAHRIGINRVPKNVTPDLQDYLERRKEREDEIDPEDAMEIEP
jgi:hypothetical protein